VNAAAPTASGPRAHVLVLLTSAAILAHEVASLRVLAIAHWHHAAHLVVAVALLAFGVAGSLVAVAPRLRTMRAAHTAAVMYAASIPLSLYAASAVEFNALAVGWEPGQWARLLLLEVTFLVPLSLGAFAVVVPLSLAGARVGFLYGSNMIGAGVGALAVLPALSLGAPEDVIRGAALLPVCAGALGGRVLSIAGAAALALVVALPARLEMTEYKPLRLAMDLPGAEVVASRPTPLARVDLVRAPSMRPAAGLSLVAREPVPPQTAAFADGESAGSFVEGDARFFGWTLAAAPAAMFDRPRVLVLGGAGNVEEWYFGADRVRRVDRVWTGENPRAYLADTADRFDVVLLRAAPSVALREDGLLTMDAFRDALAVTTEAGALAVVVPVRHPPREELRVIATARAVTPHVTAVRSMDMLCVVARRRATTDEEARALADFCRTRGFDVVGAPTRLHEGEDAAYAAALRGEAAATRDRVEPATDDAPYFHRFLPWRLLPEALAEARGLGAAQVDWGTIVAVVAAAEVTLLSVLLVAVPLLFVRRAPRPLGARRYAMLHFLSIGVAYALVQMAFLSRLTISLASPAYAAGAVTCAFLVGSGLGSLTGGRARIGAMAAAVLALAATPLLGYVRSLPQALALCAVVAFPMGLPFPAGLRVLDARAPSLVPLALAANACAGVAATAAAPLLASDTGFTVMVAIASLLYLAVAAANRQGQGIAGPAAGEAAEPRPCP
jgi:hypothetical protein